jgi:enoyl-CoA hydratase/carnithine racemase
LEATAQAIVDRLAANAPLSLRAMKASIVRQLQYRDGIEHADVDALVDSARHSRDAVEGVAARVERRPANFTGS